MFHRALQPEASVGQGFVRLLKFCMSLVVTFCRHRRVEDSGRLRGRMCCLSLFRDGRGKFKSLGFAPPELLPMFNAGDIMLLRSHRISKLEER